MKGQGVTDFVLSVVVGIVFLATAVPKLRRPRSFVLTVLDYRVLPPALGQLYGRLLPPVELWLALVLLTGSAPRLAGMLSSILLVSFIVGVSVNLARGRDLDCGCLGAGKKRPIGWPVILQDLCLLGASALLVARSTGWLAVSTWSLFHLSGLSHAAPFAPLGICLISLLVILALLATLKRSMISGPGRRAGGPRAPYDGSSRGSREAERMR